MSGKLGAGIRSRLPVWRAQLWQLYEGQYEPFTVTVLLRYLRGLVAYAYAAGLHDLVEALDGLAHRLLFEGAAMTQEVVEAEVHDLLAKLEQASEGVEDPPELRAVVIRIVPGRDFFASSLDLTLVFHELAQLGQLETLAVLDGLPRWPDLVPDVCHLSWTLVLITGQETDRLLDTLDLLASEPGMKFELEEGLDPSQIDALRLKCAAPAPVAGPAAPAAEAAPARRVVDTEGQAAPENRAVVSSGSGSIRMSIERLDKVLNSVGELVTAEGRLASVAARLSDPSLAACAEEIERLTLALRDASIGLRLQPVGALFSRFSRLVRDLSHNLGKEVDFATEGEETEIDRTVIEKLYDPLVHLIRNSLDHGLESPEVRASAGKSPHGVVRLRAFQQGAEVVIQVSDDGAGIDPAKVRAKAVEKGLIRADAALEPSQIYDLLFLPGFSTAEKVSDVSGRGVGMDVVKSNVEALRGQIDIVSEGGKGSVFSLRFPLTLAIIDGLCVEVGGEKFILPQDPIDECLDLTRYDDGGQLVKALREGRQGLNYNLRGEAVSIFTLSSVLAPDGSLGDAARVIVLRPSRGERIALVVDSILGRQQVVIKPLGPLHILRRELSGATILGDGTIALVLDLPSIVRRLQMEQSGGKSVVLG